MIIKFDLRERLALTEALNFMKGSYVKFVLAKDLISKIAITVEDVKKYQISDLTGGGITWNSEIDSSVKYEITEEQFKLIVECLNNMDAQQSLVWDIIPLYDKIMKIKEG